MKKALVLLLALLMMVSLFAGCGTKTDETKTDDPKTDDTQKEEVKTDDTKEVTDTAADGTGSSTLDTGKTDSTEEVEHVIADEITIALEADIIIDPWNTWNTARQHMMPLLYQTLAEIDPNSETGMSGVLMKDCKALGNATYEITIYDYIYDHAGNHLTADDIVFSFEGFKAAGKSVKTKIIDSVTKTGDYTVELKLTTEGVMELEGLLCNQVFIVTQAAYEASADGMATQPVSTSPYKVTDFVSGSHCTMEVWDDYWQKDPSLTPAGYATNVKKINYIIIRESSQVSINLEAGKIDAANVSSYEVARFEEGGESSEGFTALTGKIPKVWFLYFNMSPEGGLFADNLEARQAIAYAVDNQGLIDGALDGYGEPIYVFGTSNAVDYNPELDVDLFPYDVAKAQELIKSSGLEGKTIRLLTYNTNTMKILSQTIQSYLLAAGLDCEVQLLESALLQSTVYEPEGWDIVLTDKTCNFGIAEASQSWMMDSPCLTLAQDQTLEDIIIATRNAETSAEYVDQYVAYLRDNVYCRPLLTIYNNYVVRDGIDSVYLNFKGYMMPNAFTYTAEFND